MEQYDKKIPKGEHCNGCTFLKFERQPWLDVDGDCCQHGELTCVRHKCKIEVDKAVSNGSPFFQMPLYKKCKSCLENTKIPFTKQTYLVSDELKAELEKQAVEYDEFEQKEKFVLHTLVDCLEYSQLGVLMCLKYKKDEIEYEAQIDRLYDWCVIFRELERDNEE